MPRIQLKELSENERRELLKKLEEIGKSNLKQDLEQSLLSKLSQSDRWDKELLLRYLLLASILDQQAESVSARNTVIKLYEEFGRDFFMKPHDSINRIHDILDRVLKVYEPKSRVIRVSKEGVSLMRVGGFLLALLSLSSQYGSLQRYFSSFRGPRELLNKGILGNVLLKGLLYEKAARMYVGWITHPDLHIDIFEGRCGYNEIPMPVNGHVSKVMARTGFLNSVLVEEGRPIVKANEERKRIENLVKRYYPRGDFFMIDYGAFYIGFKYCREENPNCNACPISNLCKRNTKVRAF
ncbi:hypothetical protein TCELL_0684 [Thermogladius calderae 1633]|uniref:Uncharacterized protein n=1 Tax=Thermogladius calderae (strain DSM 22663 / VKM B-2946 / 1633) TaxID=1184251 RepID=I3TEC0_THEC1|nr:hypothetical protein [Thermogladius calderae]AFK51108.1 hypothetical protein TCELL_0684 [Thermogladius calderae 1633]